MSQGIVLVQRLPDEDWLHRLQESGAVRASMNTYAGPYEGIAMVPLSANTPLCRGICAHPTDDIAGPVLPFLGKLSHMDPMEHIAFVALRISEGRRRLWAQAVVEVASLVSEESAYLAAGHIIGNGPFNAVAEIMTHEAELLLELVLAFSDIDGVEVATVLRVNPEHTRGMGSPDLTEGPSDAATAAPQDPPPAKKAAPAKKVIKAAKRR